MKKYIFPYFYHYIFTLFLCYFSSLFELKNSQKIYFSGLFLPYFSHIFRLYYFEQGVPLKRGIFNSFTASINSKFVSGLLGNNRPSTDTR